MYINICIYIGVARISSSPLPPPLSLPLSPLTTPSSSADSPIFPNRLYSTLLIREKKNSRLSQATQNKENTNSFSCSSYQPTTFKVDILL